MSRVRSPYWPSFSTILSFSRASNSHCEFASLFDSKIISLSQSIFGRSPGFSYFQCLFCTVSCHYKIRSFQESALSLRGDGFWTDPVFLFFNFLWLKTNYRWKWRLFFYLKKSVSIIRKITKTYKIMTACHSALKEPIISVN